MEKRLRRLLAVVVVLALPCAGSIASIVDDVDPIGSIVYVTLSNPDTLGDSGVVEVKAEVGGSIVKSSKAYSVAGHGQTTVAVTFKSQVTNVIEVGIIEDPDPIPQ